MHMNRTGMWLRFRGARRSGTVSKDHIPFPCQILREIALQPVLLSRVMHVDDECEILIRFRRGKRSDTVSKNKIPIRCQFSPVRLQFIPLCRARQMALGSC